MSLFLISLLFLILSLSKPEYFLAILLIIPIIVKRDILFALRVPIYGIPLNLIEFLIPFLIISLYLRLITSHIKLRSQPFILPISLLFLSSLLATFIGFLNSYPLYKFFQETRVPIFFILGYLYTSIFIKEKSQIIFLLRIFILGATIASIEQLFVFLSTHGGRDVGIVSTYFFIAISLLVASTFHGKLFSRQQTNLFILINTVGIILALTRADWLGLFVSFLFIYALLNFRYKIQFSAKFISLSIIIFVGLFTFISTFGELYTLDRLYQRLETVSNLGGDESLSGRLAETTGGFDEFASGTLIEKIFGKGFGYPFYRYLPHLGIYKDAYYFHNSYMFYLLKSGIFGFTALLVLISVFINKSIKGYKLTKNMHNKTIFLGLGAGMFGVFISSLLNGKLSDPIPINSMGILFGIVAATLKMTYTGLKKE